MRSCVLFRTLKVHSLIEDLGEEVAVVICCADVHPFSQGGTSPRNHFAAGSRFTAERSAVKLIRFVLTSLAVGVLMLVITANPAAAATAGPDLSTVINNLRNWVVGLLAALATLFLTIGGIRYMLAGGDVAQIERAKSSLKSAAIGYALAALSPILVEILRSVVGA